jgi:Zn(2)-Cys(6) binuclear cluster domain-containing protein
MSPIPPPTSPRAAHSPLAHRAAQSPEPPAGGSPQPLALRSPNSGAGSPGLEGSERGSPAIDNLSLRQDNCQHEAPSTAKSANPPAKGCHSQVHPQKTGKVRRRLQLACARCRRRKTKCTGELPTCSHCLKARVPCVYKITRRPPAPRTNYMVMLDKALLKMEARIQRVTSKNTPAVRSRMSQPPTCQPSPASEDEHDCERFWHPDCEPEWGQRRDSSVAPTMEDRAAAPRTEFMLEGSEALPPVEIQEHLSKIFFTHVYGQPYFLLHKPSYMAKLR